MTGRRASLPGTLACALVFAVVTPGGAGGQEAEVPEPAMPDAPVQFRVGATISTFDWAGPGERGIRVEDRVMYGIELETLLFRYASVRIGTSYARPRLSGPDRAAEARQFLVEATAVGRAPVGPLERLGLVPFVTLGFGSVVHAPEPDDLIARNQNAYSFGGGVEWSGFHGFGARLEWKESDVDLGNLFDPQDRGARSRDLRRITGQLFWTF